MCAKMVYCLLIIYTFLDHPSYSSDMTATFGFYLFTNVKSALKGIIFQTVLWRSSQHYIEQRVVGIEEECIFLICWSHSIRFFFFCSYSFTCVFHDNTKMLPILTMIYYDLNYIYRLFVWYGIHYYSVYHSATKIAFLVRSL